jgi:hypothetical protein
MNRLPLLQPGGTTTNEFVASLPGGTSLDAALIP